MTDHQLPQFTQEEQREQAAGIITALYYGIIRYLREQDLSPEEFLTWLGERFAPTWEKTRGDLPRITYSTALNLSVSGNKLVGYEAGQDESTIHMDVMSHLPQDVSEEDVDLFIYLHKPSMDYLDLDTTIERDGNISAIHIRRRPGS